MKWSTLVVSILVFHLGIQQADACEIVAVATVITAAMSITVGLIYIATTEIHHGPSGTAWINYTTTFAELRQKVFGQHIAVEIVTKSVAQHLQNEAPSKALVLSFHGQTGIGKTYLSKHLASAIYTSYRQTESSIFVHKLVTTHYISENLDENKRRLFEFVQNGIKKGERSLFIIEEVDKFPPKLLDTLLSFMEQNVNINGQRYNPRKAIFIFLSNAGGSEIFNVVNAARSKGLDRSKISYADFESLIDSGAFTSKGGLKDSQLVSRAFIDRYVPFLPLEREHIRQCVIEYLQKRGGFTTPHLNAENAFIEKVLKQTSFVPNESERFSKFGCRRVVTMVDNLL